MVAPVIPISLKWLPVYAEGDSEEWGDEAEHWTRRFMPYAAQAADAMQEHFTLPTYSGCARGPQCVS